jgi:hypothetical protein
VYWNKNLVLHTKECLNIQSNFSLPDLEEEEGRNDSKTLVTILLDWFKFATIHNVIILKT